MKVKLYKLIKIKKGLLGEITSIKKKIHSNNTVVLPGEHIYNINELMDKYDKLIQQIVNIKKVLFENTMPIYPKIFEISELKSKILFLNKLSTKNGKVSEKRSYTNAIDVNEYKSIIGQNEKDQMIVELNKKITKLQDEIDEYNYSTIVEINL